MEYTLPLTMRATLHNRIMSSASAAVASVLERTKSEKSIMSNASAAVASVLERTVL